MEIRPASRNLVVAEPRDGTLYARILLTTFSEPLARSLSRKLRILAGNQPRVLERIEVSAVKSVAARMIKSSVPEAVLTDKNTVSELLKNALDQTSTPLPGSAQFILNEWLDVVDAWQLSTWDDYRGFKRLGRKTRLSESKRAALWSIFEEVQDRLKESRLMTSAAAYFNLAATFLDRVNKPFDYIVIDEAQDISPMQLKFVGAMAEGGANNLFFAGDLGQRIFQTPFSWASLGVQIRGRSSILRINYRTSHQIRMQADLLLDKKISDVDGNEEDRSGTVSVFNSIKPLVEVYDDESAETEGVGDWIGKRMEDRASAGEIGIFVRSATQIPRAEQAIKVVGQIARVLDENSEPDQGHVTVSTMHLAKGLEFRFVVVMACDEEVIPSQERIEEITDQSDLDEVYNTERHLLYVACTRAKDGLLVCGIYPGSEFLDDLMV